MNIEIREDELDSFNLEAKNKFNILIKDTAIEVIKESNRLACRLDHLAEHSQVTTTSVINAYDYIVKGISFTRRRKNRFLHIICYFCSALMGLIGGLGWLKHIGAIVIFIILGLVDIILATILLSKEY